MVTTNTSVLISQIFKSRKNVLDLMDKQGYDISGYSNFSVSEINAMKLNNQLDMLLEQKDDEKTVEKKKVYIRYYLTKTSIRPANLHEMIDDLFILSETLKKNDMLYIIIQDNVNETMINELKNIWERDGIFVVIENIKCLQYNILSHVTVPEHIVMSEDEVKSVMIKYNITNLNLLPEISRFDPVSRAIGLRPGQVCKIIRFSEPAIKSEYYRLCV